jgi:hypothetical protein
MPMSVPRPAGAVRVIIRVWEPRPLQETKDPLPRWVGGGLQQRAGAGACHLSFARGECSEARGKTTNQTKRTDISCLIDSSELL